MYLGRCPATTCVYLNAKVWYSGVQNSGKTSLVRDCCIFMHESAEMTIERSVLFGRPSGGI
jgi:hypothetical protein